MSARPNVLFLCTGNSCRSQMAEGWARHLLGGTLEAFSAGIKAGGLNPHMVTVMAEAGVDVSSQQSQTIDELEGVEFHTVITVCDNARDRCPVLARFPQTLHMGFDDPPSLAETAASPEEALSHYRRVRDEIRAMVEDLPRRL